MDGKDFMKSLMAMLNEYSTLVMDKMMLEKADECADAIIDTVADCSSDSKEFEKRKVLFYNRVISKLEAEVLKSGGEIEVEK